MTQKQEFQLTRYKNDALTAYLYSASNTMKRQENNNYY